MDYNYTSANLANRRQITTAPLYQYDYGQILQISGIDLPDTFEVHFSVNNQPTKTVMGSNGEVVIPDYCLTVGSAITAYIFLHSGADDGETEYVIKIPVTRRPVSTNIAPTEVQQSAITQAIAALNGALDDAEEAAARAEDAARRAEEAAAGGGASNWVNGTAEGSVRTVGSQAESDSYTMGPHAVAEGQFSQASGRNAHAEGQGSKAIGINSHAEGTGSKAEGDTSHAECGSTASGNYSHAEGYGLASGNRSHAENSGTASGTNSHAENNGTASGEYSHAEGELTKAIGLDSHAEGFKSEAQGNYSHAEGYGTIAEGVNQHVFGKYNIADSSMLEIVGNGRDFRNPMTGVVSIVRKNVRTLDSLGNETLAGKLTVGADPEEEMDVATKQYVDSRGSGGGSNALWVNLSQPAEQSPTLDKTYTEIANAMAAETAVYIQSSHSSGSGDSYQEDHKAWPVALAYITFGSDDSRVYEIVALSPAGPQIFTAAAPDVNLELASTLSTGRVINIWPNETYPSYDELYDYFFRGDQVLLRDQQSIEGSDTFHVYPLLSLSRNSSGTSFEATFGNEPNPIRLTASDSGEPMQWALG